MSFAIEVVQPDSYLSSALSVNRADWCDSGISRPSSCRWSEGACDTEDVQSVPALRPLSDRYHTPPASRGASMAALRGCQRSASSIGRNRIVIRCCVEESPDSLFGYRREWQAA